MGLFSFFKKSDKLGQENTIDSKDLLQNIKVENTDNNQDVVTKLSYHQIGKCLKSKSIYLTSLLMS